MSGFVAGAVIGYVAVGTVAAIAVGAVVGYVVGGAVMDMLTPDMPDVGAGTQGAMTNKASSNDPIPIIYGERRIGATQVFVETSGSDNIYLYEILILGEGEIDSVTEIIVDDESLVGSKFENYVTYTIHSGLDDQAADSNLMSASSGWTSNHRLRGTAYAYVRLEYDQDTFTGGIPTINFVTKGVKVYDPRTSTTAWSDNPALCIRDYLTNTRYGRGLDASEIDDTSFSSAANYCDELVDLTGLGTTVKRYTCNGVVNTESGSIATLKALTSCCKGMLVFTAGKYKLIIDKAESAGFAFNSDNVVGGWNIRMGSKRSRYNKISADFANKETSWRDDIAYSESSTYKTNDNGLKLEQTIKLPFNTDIERSQMLCAILLNQSRQQIAVSFIATVEALQVEVGEVVTITDDGMGWTNKEFRVERMDMKSSSEVKMSVREYDSTVYDFGNVTAQDAIPNTYLPDLNTVATPTAISATESLYDTIGSAGVKVRITLDWIAANDRFVREYEVQWKKNGSSTWLDLVITRTLQAILNDADPDLYDFRVRSINTLGVRSDWATLSNVTIAGLTAPPVDVDGLSLIALNNNAHISWDLATDLDVRVGGKVTFKHSNLTSGASWESSTAIGSAVAGHNTTAVLPLVSGTYLAKFIDSTGNASVDATSYIATTVPDIVKMNFVETSTQNPTFSGTKTNMIVESSALKVGALLAIDDETDLIDDWGLMDDIGGIDLSTSNGTYEFDTYIDLGAVYTSRVTANLAFSAATLADTIDSRVDLIDTWTDFENAPSDVVVDLYITSTNDDPSGSPTWGAWTKFTVADYSARAFKFKIEADTASQDNQISITTLTATVDMPDRVQGDNAIQSGVGTKSITYADAFYAIPSVGITGCDMDQNDRIVLSNETATGFDVSFYQGNGSGNPVDIKFNWQSRGF